MLVMATAYSFINISLEEECRHKFIVTLGSISKDPISICEDIRDKLFRITNWEKCDVIVGEPEDHTFPFMEFGESGFIFRYEQSIDDMMSCMTLH